MIASYDPTTMAKLLSDKYMFARQSSLENEVFKNQNTEKGLNLLKSAMNKFQNSLNGIEKKINEKIIKTSNENIAKITANSKVNSGIYQFQVKELATAQQSLYSLDKFNKSSEINIIINNGNKIKINSEDIKKDSDGKLLASDLAKIISEKSEGKISASIIKIDGQDKLILNSNKTGIKNSFKLEISHEEVLAIKELNKAKDAKFIIGSNDDGLEITQSSNTYKGINGLTIEFKELTKNNNSLTININKNNESTKKSLEDFIHSYNELLSTIEKLTDIKNEDFKKQGPLNSDNSVKNLKYQLHNLLKTEINGIKLTDFGVALKRDGNLELDNKRFEKQIKTNSEDLVNLLGKTNLLENKRTGVLGKLETYFKSWTNNNDGVLHKRKENLEKTQLRQNKEQIEIDKQYQIVYDRYFAQFNALKQLQENMNNTSNLLNSLFN